MTTANTTFSNNTYGAVSHPFNTCAKAQHYSGTYTQRNMHQPYSQAMAPATLHTTVATHHHLNMPVVAGQVLQIKRPCWSKTLCNRSLQLPAACTANSTMPPQWASSSDFSDSTQCTRPPTCTRRCSSAQHNSITLRSGERGGSGTVAMPAHCN